MNGYILNGYIMNRYVISVLRKHCTHLTSLARPTHQTSASIDAKRQASTSPLALCWTQSKKLHSNCCHCCHHWWGWGWKYSPVHVQTKEMKRNITSVKRWNGENCFPKMVGVEVMVLVLVWVEILVSHNHLLKRFVLQRGYGHGKGLLWKWCVGVGLSGGWIRLTLSRGGGGGLCGNTCLTFLCSYDLL